MSEIVIGVILMLVVVSILMICFLALKAAGKSDDHDHPWKNL